MQAHTCITSVVQKTSMLQCKASAPAVVVPSSCVQFCPLSTDQLQLILWLYLAGMMAAAGQLKYGDKRTAQVSCTDAS